MSTIDAAVKFTFNAEALLRSKFGDGMGMIIGRFVGQEPTATVNVTVAGTAHASQFRVIENHPLASLFGKYANEPLWVGFERAIEQDRAVINADQTAE